MKFIAPLAGRVTLCALGSSACLLPSAHAYVAGADTPRIYESYDKNPLGDMVGTTSGGYGVAGTYAQVGSASAGAVKIVAEGLAFGSFNPITANSKCIQIDANNTPTGAAIAIDGGKTLGDISEFPFYDNLYCSFLVNYSNVTNLAGGRSEIRIADAVTGTGNLRFQIGIDRTGASSIQPSLGYGTVFPAVPGTPTLDKDKTYLMISHFGNVGNLMAFTATARFPLGTQSITLSSASNLSVGQLVQGTGIPEDTFITGVSGATITINKPTTVNTTDTAVYPTTPTLTFCILDNPDPVTNPIPAPVATTTATWTTATTATMTVANSAGLSVGQLVQAPGIPAHTVITSIAGNVVSLGRTPVAAATTATSVTFYTRKGTASLYALTLEQYENFIKPTANGGGGGLQSYLENAAVGDLASNVSLSIKTKAQTGPFPFGSGNAIHILAQGNTGSNQKYKMDELRYGPTLRSVTQPAPYLTGPSNEVIENALDVYSEYFDGGSGWKSGYYEVAENNATPGARAVISSSTITPLRAGSANALQVIIRNDIGSDQGVRRRPDPAVVDMSKSYTVSFDFRMGSGVTTFNSFADRIQFGADSSGTNFGPNSPTMTWMVGVIGGDDTNPETARDIYENEWYFANGDEFKLGATTNTFVRGNMIRSELPYTGVHAYSIKVEVNMDTRRYSATVTDLVSGVSKTAHDLKFRITSVTPTPFAANSIFWGISKSANEGRSFLLDNIRLVQGISDVDAYPAWADVPGTFPAAATTADKDRTADYDKDGRANFVEFALDGNPASGSNNGKVVSAVQTVGATQHYTITLPVRNGSLFTADPTVPQSLTSQQVNFTKYKIEGSYDLANFNAEVVEVTPAITSNMPVLSDGYSYKTFRLRDPISAHSKGFLRVKVTGTAP